VTRIRVVIFLGVWAVPQCLLFALFMGAPGGTGSGGFSLVPLIALVGAPLGPLAGAVARSSQSTVVGFSLELLPWFLPFLGAASASFLIRRTASKGLQTLRLSAWGIGWFGRMTGSILSLGYALG